jgi:hypothetical protein
MAKNKMHYRPHNRSNIAESEMIRPGVAQATVDASLILWV